MLLLLESLLLLIIIHYYCVIIYIFIKKCFSFFNNTTIFILNKITNLKKVIYENKLPTLVIISSGLVGCILQWLLILQYAIRLCLSKLYIIYVKINNDFFLNILYNLVLFAFKTKDDLMTIIYGVFVCLDCIFEASSASVLILANLYCARVVLNLPHFKTAISYCNSSLFLLLEKITIIILISKSLSIYIKP